MFFVSTLFSLPVLAQDKSNGDGDVIRFFEVLTDIPLMDGLTEMTEYSIVFDKPAGRIVELTAIAPALEVGAIKSFYSATLPQLGWVAKGNNIFIREHEKLSITIETEDGYIVVSLRVDPL